MKYITLILIAIVTLASCEKDPIEDITVPPTMTIEPTKTETDETNNITPTVTSSNTTTGVSSETTQVESGTATDTKDEGTESTTATETTEVEGPKDEGPGTDVETVTATPTVEIEAPTGLGDGEYIDDTIVAPAGTIYLSSHFDGKETRTHTYRVDNSGSYRVMMVYIDDSPYYNEGTKHWFFGGLDNFQVQDGYEFTVYGAEMTITDHRGIQVYHRPSQTPRFSELDRALDLAGDNWDSDVIYQFDELASIGGFAGLARNREFIVSIGGFETHVLLHENGHNYDFEHEEYMSGMSAIYPEGGYVGYYTGPIAEFRAEMFARYYLLRDAMPQIIRDLLDLLLG